MTHAFKMDPSPIPDCYSPTRGSLPPVKRNPEVTLAILKQQVRLKFAKDLEPSRRKPLPEPWKQELRSYQLNDPEQRRKAVKEFGEYKVRIKELQTEGMIDELRKWEVTVLSKVYSYEQVYAAYQHFYLVTYGRPASSYGWQNVR